MNQTPFRPYYTCFDVQVAQADLDLPLPHIFHGLMMLQQNALEKLAARDKYGHYHSITVPPYTGSRSPELPASSCAVPRASLAK